MFVCSSLGQISVEKYIFGGNQFFTWVNVCTSDFAKTSSQHLLDRKCLSREMCF